MFILHPILRIADLSSSLNALLCFVNTFAVVALSVRVVAGCTELVLIHKLSDVNVGSLIDPFRGSSTICQAACFETFCGDAFLKLPLGASDVMAVHQVCHLRCSCVHLRYLGPLHLRVEVDFFGPNFEVPYLVH